MKYITIICLFLSTTFFGAVEAVEAEAVPVWVLAGILGVESSSFYNADGSITYVNQRRGRDGELGPWQCTRDAFDDVKKPGDDFRRLARDPVYAEGIAIRRLLWLQKELGPGWDRIIRAYNKGVGGARKGRGHSYLTDVKAWAKRVMPEAMP
jgi:hypothetical protein